MSDKSDKSVEAKGGDSFDWSWLAWVLPVLAIAMAAWLVYRAIPNPSASLVVVADEADGIQENNTLVYNLGVEIGRVSTVALTEDYSEVEITVELDEGRGAFAQEGARYWIVRPELDNSSLQGLSTIVSGPEIHATPGNGGLVERIEVDQVSPLQGVGPDDLKLGLESMAKSGLNRGSVVNYRGMKVGVVTAVELSDDSSFVNVDANIFADHAHLVRNNSMFWNSGGLDIDFGLFSGADVNVGSVSSLFAGAVSFATPDEPGAPVNSGHIFSLADEAEDEWQEWRPSLPAN